jgi:hypothetical protein
MSTILRPKLGFAAGEEKRNKGQLDEGTRSPGPVLRPRAVRSRLSS